MVFSYCTGYPPEYWARRVEHKAW